MNSAVGRQQGISDEQLADLADFEMSSQFNDQEKAVLRYAEGMTCTPADVSFEAAFSELGTAVQHRSDSGTDRDDRAGELPLAL